MEQNNITVTIPTMKQIPQVLKLLERRLNTLNATPTFDTMDRSAGLLYVIRIGLIEQCKRVMGSSDSATILLLAALLKQLDDQMLCASDTLILQEQVGESVGEWCKCIQIMKELYRNVNV